MLGEMDKNTAAPLTKPESIESKAQRWEGPLPPLLAPRSHQPNLTLPTPSIRHDPFPSHPNWISHTYVIPAAYPRSIPGSSKTPTTPTRADGNESERVDLQAALVDLYTAQVDANLNRVKLENGKLEEEQEQLFLVVNKYSRKDLGEHEGRELAQNGLTMILAHANGFHKEIWEPMLDDLLTVQDPAIPIFEFWALDCVCQGDSGWINEHSLGNTFAWQDNGRDLLQFITTYLPSPMTPSYFTPITTLPPLPLSSTSTLRLLDSASPNPGSPIPSFRKFRDRLLIGVGHSLGGAATVFASTALPCLFSSVILIDPVLVPPPPIHKDRYTTRMTAGALVRRERWASRKEAESGFLKKAFFQAWDQRVFSRYVEFGLKDLEKGVALKARAKDEALVFADPLSYSSHRACIRLDNLTPHLPIHFILPSLNCSVLPESAIDWLLNRGAPQSTSVRIEDTHHLLVQEKPRRTAEEIVKFLKATYALQVGTAKL